MGEQEQLEWNTVRMTVEVRVLVPVALPDLNVEVLARRVALGATNAPTGYVDAVVATERFSR